jgi:hypothetical protein
MLNKKRRHKCIIPKIEDGVNNIIMVSSDVSEGATTSNIEGGKCEVVPVLQKVCDLTFDLLDLPLDVHANAQCNTQSSQSKIDHKVINQSYWRGRGPH